MLLAASYSYLVAANGAGGGYGRVLLMMGREIYIVALN